MKLNKKKYANQPGAMKKSYTNEVDLVEDKSDQEARQEGKLFNPNEKPKQ